MSTDNTTNNAVACVNMHAQLSFRHLIDNTKIVVTFMSCTLQCTVVSSHI